MQPKAVIEGGRLTIPNLAFTDADIYICSTPDAPSFPTDKGSLLIIPNMLRYHLKNTTPTDITAESSNVCVLDYMYY
jgi:hypothetical protein